MPHLHKRAPLQQATGMRWICVALQDEWNTLHSTVQSQQVYLVPALSFCSYGVCGASAKQDDCCQYPQSCYRGRNAASRQA